MRVPHAIRYLVLGLMIAAPARAADLTVSLRTLAGKPVSEAVVMVTPEAGLPKGPIRFPWPYRMAQKNLTFAPFVLVAPVGAEVAFPNFDPVLHHVYSFSPAKPFELKLYGKDETRNVRFDKPGVVAIGCNIHDDMTAYIRVVETPFAGKSAADGEVVISGLPAGPATVVVWHPYLKAPRGELIRKTTVAAAGGASLVVSLDLRPAPMKHGAY